MSTMNTNVIILVTSFCRPGTSRETSFAFPKVCQVLHEKVPVRLFTRKILETPEKVRKRSPRPDREELG